MSELLIYLALSVILLVFGYLVSVFSNAIYIDPEDIRAIFPELSVRHRAQLQRLTDNPRAFFQIGLLVRTSSAILLGILALLCARRVAALTHISEITAVIVIFALLWMIALMMFIYLPRRVPQEQARARLIRFLPLMNIIYLISAPVIRGFGRVSTRKSLEAISEEQKDDIVERAIETLAETAGISSPIIEEDEKEMIHQIFQLDVTEVEEIMIPRISITGIEISAELDHIREIVAEHGYSRYPVYEGTIDNIIGIINVKDLLLLGEHQRQNFKVGNHIREPLRVGEHKKIDQLLTEFKKNKTHMAIVMDEFGGTAGLATLEDILEEIVGEIEDEHDPQKDEAIVRLSNGTLEVSGTCPLEDLADELDLELEQEEFETVGGMIYDMVGSVPSEGTSLRWQNCQIKVLRVEGQRIQKVLVVPA